MTDPDYFTLDEFRDLPDCTGSTFTDAQVNAAAAHFTTIVEREVGEPFIPRTFTDTLDGNSLGSIVLSQSHPRSLTTVTVGGVTVDTSLLNATSGVLRYSTVGGAWTSGIGNVAVTYVAGRFATCPADVKDAVMWATRDRLLGQTSESGIDTRRTSVSTEFGVTNYVLPGEKRPTGYPDLDALIASYVRTTPSFGFA